MTVGALFGQAVWDYDRTRRKFVPGFDRFYGVVLESISFREEWEIWVLDLGVGTGLFSVVVAGKFPRAQVTLVDLLVEMFRVACRRFSGEQGRFEFRTMDYARKSLSRTEGGYDLVVSVLSVHHLTHGDKRELFEKVYDSLAGGGYFVNVDQIFGETLEEEDLYVEWWLRRVCEAGVSEEDLVVALSRMRADRNVTLGAQLLWLGEVGFEGIGCRYRDHRFVVYNGRKGYGNLENRKDDDG